MAAAKEFNVGQDTIVEFLVGKGFSKDEMKPTSKLSEDMYRALQQEFQSDKAAKMKSDQVDLPKGTQAEGRKKKEDEDISFGKAPARAVKKEEPKKEEEKEKPEEKKTKKEEPKKEKEEEIAERAICAPLPGFSSIP